MKRSAWRLRHIFILFVVIFLFPVMLYAGGQFQGKIQQKINASRNIQYGVDQMYYDTQDASAPATPAAEQKISCDTYNRRTQDVETKDLTNPSPAASSYAIYKTTYKAEIEEDVVTIKGDIFFQVFSKGWTQIPLVNSNVGLIEVTVNRGASFVTMQAGKYYLMIDKPGKYNLEIEFLVKANRERENGPGSFSFEASPAPISQFEFTIPEQDVEVFIEPSIKSVTKREAKSTNVWAVMPNTNRIQVRWTKALPKETITHVKLEPKVYCDIDTYAAIGEGVIRCRTTLRYSILQSEVSNFRIALPEDVGILEVQGGNLRDWKVTQDKDSQYLDVYLNFGIKGNHFLVITYERKIGEGSITAQIPEVKALGVEREKGYVGVAAATNVELAVNKTEHANLVDVKELPSAIWTSTASPILLAFKYLNHPYRIVVDVTKHEELPVLVAAIDSAQYITLYTDEGKSLTKAVYQIRNNVKQYIHLKLPPQATLWSVFVANKPVKPAKDKSGNILIPLEKSQLSGENLAQFPVEIVYLDKGSKMVFAGNLGLRLPQTDIPVSSLMWSVYLPLDYAYIHFGGNVRPQVKRVSHFNDVMLFKAASVSRSNEYATQQYAIGELREEERSAQVKGVLPIKIDIPQQGSLYSFSKLLVTENDIPRINIIFLYAFRKLHGLFWFAVVLVIFITGGKVLKKILLRKAS
ncbi:MAG: hypothetical protein WCI77_09105 [Candidatus Omnitrophota bacterium]